MRQVLRRADDHSIRELLVELLRDSGTAQPLLEARVWQPLLEAAAEAGEGGGGAPVPRAEEIVSGACMALTLVLGLCPTDDELEAKEEWAAEMAAQGMDPEQLEQLMQMGPQGLQQMQAMGMPPQPQPNAHLYQTLTPWLFLVDKHGNPAQPRQSVGKYGSGGIVAAAERYEAECEDEARASNQGRWKSRAILNMRRKRERLGTKRCQK